MADARGLTLSLAAATILDIAPPEQVTCAARAGFPAVGLRFDPTGDTSALVRETRHRLDDVGVRVLDIEVVRLLPRGGDAPALRLLEIGAALDARHLLLVSHDVPSRTVERFERICERAADLGLRVALEFMAFTSVRTLDDAVAVVEAAGHPAGCVLVDALHLERTGGTPADLTRVPINRLPYVQLADAIRRGRDDDAERCAQEARHGRLMPGDGALPITDFLCACLDRPDVEAVSVEAPSDILAARHGPLERASLALAAAQRVLARAVGRR